MNLTHFYCIFYLNYLLVVLLVTASTQNHDQWSWNSLGEYNNNNTEEFESETEYESEETLKNNFYSDWNAKTKSQSNTIIPEKSDELKINDTSKEMESQIPTIINNEGGNNTSFFQDAFSAFRNFKSDSDTFFHQLKNQSGNAIREMQQTGTVLGNAVETIVDIAFPKGKNTSFIEGMTNIVTELEATGKELENWPIKEVIAQRFKETATNFLGQSVSPVTVMPDLLKESDSETIHVHNDYASHQMESISPTNSNNNMDDPTFKMQSRINYMILLIGIGIVVTACIVLSVILLYIIYTRRVKSKTISQTLKNKKQSYSIEQTKPKLDKINTQIEIEQRTDLIKNSKLDIEQV